MDKAGKKVLFVATVDSHIELFHLPYLKMFHDKGWEVHVATDTGKKIEYCDKKIKMPIKRSPFKLVSNYKAMRKLREVMKKEGYSIVHCHTPMGGVVARMAGRKLRRQGQRMIYTAHGFHFYKGAPVHYWLMFYPVEWYLAKYTDTLITINDEDYQRAKKRFSKRCRDIQYVPGVGVDPKKFEKKMSGEEKVALRKSLGLAKDDKVLVCIGRLDKNKNQGFLIKAMNELVARDSSYHLLLVGPDEIDGKYQKLTAILNLNKNVHFLGFRNDISELMQISDVAVSASRREGLPVNLIEATMLNLPIVALCCRGATDICEKIGRVTIIQGDISSFIENVLNIKDVKYDADVLKKFKNTNICRKMSEIYNRKKRILHVLASDRFSGAENVACTIIRNLSDEFEMAYCSPEGPIRETLKERNINYYGIKKLSRKNLRKIIDEYRPDIIHAHDFKASFVAAKFYKNHRIISHLHKNDPKMRKISIKSLLYLFESKRLSKIIGASESIFNEYIYSNRVKSKYITIPNYVDKNEIIKKSREFKVDKKYDLFFFGRLSDEKNPLMFIEIVKALNNPDIKCIMIGDGPLCGECKKRIAQYGLEKNIEMVGFKSNPYPYVNAARIGIMPSKFEGYGLTAIESTVLSKPVINSGVGNLDSIFSETNLSVNNFNDYIRIVKKTEFNLPNVDKFLDYDFWRNNVLLAYSHIRGIND